MVSVAARPRDASAPRPQAAWWRYVERGRSHEVRVDWCERASRLRVVEFAPAAPDARIVQESQARPWEARVALWVLEARLAHLGEYWRQRSDAKGWSPVLRPAGAPSADARENEVVRPAGAAFVHHYHDERAGVGDLLAALRAEQASRFLVVRAALDVTNLDAGRVHVLHRDLPAPLARSAIASEQLALTQVGLGKLVTRDDYRRAFGDGGDRRAARLVDEVVRRVRTGHMGGAALIPEAADEYGEFLAALQDPRLLALHRRFLRGDEEDEILSRGAVEIRKAVRAKRGEVDHREQHLLTILEASLLAREKMRSGSLERSGPEVRALARLAYYL